MHSVRVSPQAMRKQRIVSLSRSWYVCFSAYWIGIVPGGPNEGFVLTTCKRAFWATQSTFRYLEMHVGNWDSADVGITCFRFGKILPPPPPLRFISLARRFWMFSDVVLFLKIIWRKSMIVSVLYIQMPRPGNSWKTEFHRLKGCLALPD